MLCNEKPLNERPTHRKLSVAPVVGFPGGSAGKESACNAGDLGLTPGLGRSLGDGKGYPLQYSGLENSTDCIVHGVAKSQTRLRDFHFHMLVEIRESPLVAMKTQHRKKKKT